MLVIRLLTALALRAGVLFAAVGDWHMPAFWVYPGLCSGLAVLFLPSIDWGLQRERLSGGTTGEWQYFRALLAPFAVAHLVVGGRDVGRFRWSGHFERAAN